MGAGGAVSTSGTTSAGGTSGGSSEAGAGGAANCLAGWKGSSCDMCSSSAMPAGCTMLLDCESVVLGGGKCTDTGAKTEDIRLAALVYDCRCPQ